MGGCLSGRPSKEVDERLILPPKAEAASQDWQGDIRDIWSRGFENLPVHSDVPRLARKIRILDSKGIEIRGKGENEGKTVQEIVLSIFLVLAKQTNADDVDNLTSRYPEYIKEGGDFSQQLLLYLKEVVGDSSVGKILKACHQRVIFPGYYNMKAKIYNDCPFKDSRGSWEVDIQFLEGGQVLVTHRKAQVSRHDWHSASATTRDDSNPSFTFQWALKIVLESDLCNIADTSLSVTGLDVSNAVSPERKKAIADVIVVDEQIC